MPGSAQTGEMLRRRREELGISLDVAADATNIRSRMLATLEEGDFSKYPQRGHASGMLTSYARFLELDPRPILECFEAEWADYEEQSEMASVAERTRLGVGRFGEHVSADNRPLPRDSSRATGRMHTDRRDSTGAAARLSERLSEERAAKDDGRYTTGSVKIVARRGSEETGRSRPRSASRGTTGSLGRSATGSSRRLSDDAESPTIDVRSHDAGEEPAPHRPAASGRLSASRDRSGYFTSTDARTSWRFSSDDNGERPAFSGRLSSIDIPEVSSSATTGPLPAVSRTASTAQDRHARDGVDEALDSEQREALSYFSGEMPAVKDGSPAISSAPVRAAAEDAAASAEAERREKADNARSQLIVAAIAFIIAAAIIAAVVLVTTSGSSDSGVLEVSGGAESSSTDSATATVSTTDGTPVTMTVTVAEGEASLVTIVYDDDSAYNGTAVGPWTREFQVAESFSVTVGNPDVVTIEQDGEKVALAEDSEGNGVFVLEVNNASSTDKSDDGDSSSKKSAKKKSSSKKSSKNSSED